MGIKSPIFIKILNDTHDIVTLMTHRCCNDVGRAKCKKIRVGELPTLII